jgi:hypothetical protein
MESGESHRRHDVERFPGRRWVHVDYPLTRDRTRAFASHKTCSNERAARATRPLRLRSGGLARWRWARWRSTLGSSHRGSLEPWARGAHWAAALECSSPGKRTLPKPHARARCRRTTAPLAVFYLLSSSRSRRARERPGRAPAWASSDSRRTSVGFVDSLAPPSCEPSIHGRQYQQREQR